MDTVYSKNFKKMIELWQPQRRTAKHYESNKDDTSFSILNILYEVETYASYSLLTHVYIEKLKLLY